MRRVGSNPYDVQWREKGGAYEPKKKNITSWVVSRGCSRVPRRDRILS
jgi:hypothetical protein